MKDPEHKARFTKAPFASERGRCSWCGTTNIPKGRRNWCSQKCVDEYLLRASPQHIRAAVHKRDRGICALCGCDAEAEYRAWGERHKEVARLADRLVQSARSNATWNGSRWEFLNTDFPTRKEWQAFRAYMVKKYAPGGWTKGRRSGWDADHIVPVAEGGGQCDLANYRTLCHPCHKQVTANLMSRIAEARRIQKRRATGDLFTP